MSERTTTRQQRMAWALAGCMGAVALLQVALALGAPLGAFAWGGAGGAGVLPDHLRAASGGAVAMLALSAVIVLGRAGLVLRSRFETALRGGCGLVTVQLGLSTLGNLASPSLPERVVMTPLAAVMTVLALGVARGEGRGRKTSPA